MDVDTKDPSIKENFEQRAEMYPWGSFKSFPGCSCLNFILQLVFLACLGSFSFGFNLALLNTAMSAVNADFQLCGPYPPELQLASIHGTGFTLEEKCSSYLLCVQRCFEDGGSSKFICGGGNTDISCPELKWYNAAISAAILVGGAIGSLAGGKLMARGRRALLMITMAVLTCGAITCVCANSFPAMTWGRLLLGIGVGLAAVAAPTYMAEVTPPQSRGFYGTFHQLLVTVGIVVAMLLGLPLANPAEQPLGWTMPVFQRVWWRVMLGLGVVPALIGLYLLGAVYSFETPVYYVEQRRFKDAAALLEFIYQKSDVREELDSVIEQVRSGEEQKKNGMTFSSAFADPEYRYVIIIGIIFSMGQQFGGINVFMTSSNELFRKAGLSGSMQTGMSIIMAVINVLMTFPTIVLIEKMGRRTLALVGCFGQFLAVVPAAISYWTEADPERPGRVTQVLAILAVLGFVLFFAVAYGPVLWVYLFEIYPMEIKDVAAGVATMMNWIAGVVMVFVALVLPNQVSFSLFAGLQLMVSLFVFFFIRETKGRTLGDSPYFSVKPQQGV